MHRRVSMLPFLEHTLCRVWDPVHVRQSGVSAIDNTDNEDEDFNYEYWKLLDPTYIQYLWGQSEIQRPIMMSASLIGAMAWFWLIVPILQSAWILSKGCKRSVGPHMTLVAVRKCVVVKYIFFIPFSTSVLLYYLVI